MGPDETDKNEKEGAILDLSNQPIGVALDVENDAIAWQKVRRAKDRPDFGRTCPRRPLDDREPKAKRLLGIGVLLPKFDERVPAEDAQLADPTMLPRWEQQLALRRVYLARPTTSYAGRTLKHAAMKDANRLAKSVIEAWAELNVTLEDKRRWPREQFRQLFSAVTAYANANAGDKMIHRSVAECVNGLREYLQIQRKRVPGDALFDADRLETIVFSGCDPAFQGDEPPGL